VSGFRCGLHVRLIRGFMNQLVRVWRGVQTAIRSFPSETSSHTRACPTTHFLALIFDPAGDQGRLTLRGHSVSSRT
jgi:hypothetical protein